MKRNEDGTYQPGFIYELRCKIDDAWHPFYVGETISISQRIGQHRVSAKYADDTSTLVYRFIHDYLDANNIEWDLFEIDQYGVEGPEALEDEHIMRLLVDNVALKNTKKGNANWMDERMAVADDMRERKITSYKRYKEVLTYEEQQRRVDEANALRLIEEVARQALEQQRQEQERLRQEQLTKQELVREQVRQQMIEQAKVFAEQAKIKLEQENQARLARAEAERQAWEADAPARALRIKIETERLAEEDRQRQIQEEKQQLAKQKRLAEVDANITAHEERMKLVKAEEKKMLERAQARMAKILEKK